MCTGKEEIVCTRLARRWLHVCVRVRSHAHGLPGGMVLIVMVRPLYMPSTADADRSNVSVMPSLTLTGGAAHVM